MMTATEELLVFLELNGYDVNKFKYNIQLSKEIQGNLKLIQKSTIKDFLEEYYLSSEEKDILHLNPLIYIDLWKNCKVDKEVVSIEDFYINHPRVEEDLTVYEFLNDKMIKDDIKIRVISEEITRWVREYKSFVKRTLYLENEWMELMTREVEYQQTPPLIKLIPLVTIFFLFVFSVQPPFLNFTIYHDVLLSNSWFLSYTLVFIFFLISTISRYDGYRSQFVRVKKREYIRFQKKRTNILSCLEKVELEFGTLLEQDEIVSKKVMLKRISKFIKIMNDLKLSKLRLIEFEKVYLNVIKKYKSVTNEIGKKTIVVVVSFVVYLLLGFLLGKGLI